MIPQNMRPQMTKLEQLAEELANAVRAADVSGVQQLKEAANRIIGEIRNTPSGSEDKPQTKLEHDEDSYQLSARLWKRKSVEPEEWVLTIEGAINDTYLSCNHAQSASLAPEDVPGLPELYNKVELISDLEIMAQCISSFLNKVQEYDRPLPWMVATSCSYRRIMSQITKENPRSFKDGNVLSATKHHHDNHLDLNMGEENLMALVGIINLMPMFVETVSKAVANDADPKPMHMTIASIANRMQNSGNRDLINYGRAIHDVLNGLSV